MEPNGLWYGIQMPVESDEPTTEDNPIKVYVFRWENNGKTRTSGRFFKTLKDAIEAADQHRKQHAKSGYRIVGKAICGFAL